jgi:FeS assembly SUF system regulator
MIRLSKRSDYGLIALKHLAQHVDEPASAADIAAAYQIPTPLMAKVLQKLAKQGLVEARHGAGGGYRLGRDPSTITALDVIAAIDGPFTLTSCTTHHGDCRQVGTCNVREPLRRVNATILELLKHVTISQMTDEASSSPVVELRI